jgi:predicted O-methyltransferase YrrM
MNESQIHLLNQCLSLSLLNGESIDSSAHIMTIFSIAIQIKAKRILELGVREGYTSSPLLLAASLCGGKLTSVDIEQTKWNPPNDLQSNYEFVLSDAIQFLEKQEGKYDLILIDDWHTYNHVKKELELCENLIDENSIILLHDLMAHTFPKYFLPDTQDYNGTEWEGGGPYKAVMELDREKWEWATIPVCHGLTILRKKTF